VLDPAQSAAQAVADYLTAAVVLAPPLDVRRGWNEANREYDLSGGPVATVTATGTPQANYRTPYTYETAPIGGLFSWVVADLEIFLQLDLWCPHRHTRDVVSELVEQKLSNDIPYRAGLYLTHADYHGSAITVWHDRGHTIDGDPLVPSVDEWRATWLLRVHSAKIVQAATPQQLNWELRRMSGAVLLETHPIDP